MVFLVCTFISAAMWLFIELEKDYNDELQFRVHLTNAPEDLILVNSEDTTLNVGVNAQGFEIFTYRYLKRAKILELNLASLHIRQNGDGFSAYLPSAEIINQIGQQLPFSKAINTVNPDTLYFKFAQISRKRVPVRIDLSYTTKQQYFLYDSVRIVPGYVTAMSIKEVIDTLHFVTTVHIDKQNIDSTITFKVPLSRRLHRNLLKFATDSVQVTIPVEKYTETQFTVPVKFAGAGDAVKLYPSQVEISCLVPMIDFPKIDASQFEASVSGDNQKLSAGKALKVEITRSPAKVRITRIKPENIEYLLLPK